MPIFTFSTIFGGIPFGIPVCIFFGLSLSPPLSSGFLKAAEQKSIALIMIHWTWPPASISLWIYTFFCSFYRPRGRHLPGMGTVFLCPSHDIRHGLDWISFSTVLIFRLFHTYREDLFLRFFCDIHWES